jgi:hypothetical protein
LATGPDFDEYRPSADPGCGDSDLAGFPGANPSRAMKETLETLLSVSYSRWAGEFDE